MPIKKRKVVKAKTKVENTQPCVNKCCHIGCDFTKKIMVTLLGVLLVYVIFYIGVLIRNNIQEFYYIGQADKIEKMITINGYGKAIGTNDIAVTTLGYSNTAVDVSDAQKANKKTMDGIMSDLKEIGIDEKDLQSNYTIYPEYEYHPEEGRKFKGYKVTSNVTIKIRDLSKIEEVLSLAGKYHANQISGLQFTIDDTQNLKAEAREKAIADAKEKALKLSQDLGVQIVGVVSYNEYESTNYAPRLKTNYMFDEALGMGGVADIASGSQDVSVNVNITYEIVR